MFPPPSPVLAAPGDLDPAFSGDGKQTTDFGTGFEGAQAVAIQPDGKIVAVGCTTCAERDGFVLARYNPDGTLDPSFSGDGMQVTDFGSGNESAEAVAIDGDGKIVAVGWAIGVSTDFALARYNTDGTLDPSFSGDGLQLTDFEGAIDVAYGVAIQADAKIIVAGFAQNDTDVFALARYNADGTLDPSFNGDGKRTTFFRQPGARAYDVMLQPDGRIVAAGYAFPFSDADADFALARYRPSGRLDRTFSQDGRRMIDIGGQSDEAYGVAMQGSQRIVVVGHGGLDFALARCLLDGSLDTGFDGDGITVTDFGSGEDGARAVAVQKDGKLVVGGYGYIGGETDFALARYLRDGSLDDQFGVGGKVTTDFGSSYDYIFGLALQADGKIVAAGWASISGYDFGIARYLAT